MPSPDLLYRPVSFFLNEKEHKIQYNFCGNPFCKWHGLPQDKFTSVKGNPSRYRLSGRGKGENQAIICNDDPIGVIKGMTWLVTARGDGKSNIYANFNPKYAQYALTILRTFYNFCEATKDLDGEERTPAQRLGLVEKQFSLKDILYLR